MKLRVLALFALPLSTLPLIALAACSSGDEASPAPQTTDDASTTTPDAAITRDAGGNQVDAGSDTAVDAAPRGDAGTAAERQHPIAIDSTVAPPNGYYEYLPPYYDASTSVPLLVFWHGLGEDGSGKIGELQKVLANGPPKLIAANKWPNDRPFVVLSPQHANGGCPSGDEIDKFITFALGHYAIDPKRIYLTGLSCGAIGSWDYITKYKDKAVAATLLISGNPGNAFAADGCSLVSKLALWSVHGDQDPTVPYQPDRDTLQSLLACLKPRADVKWSPVAGGGHDVWTSTYDLSGGRGDVYAWMLANPKP